MRLATVLGTILCATASLLMGQSVTSKNSSTFDRSITFLLDDDELVPKALTLPAGRYRFVVENGFTNARLDLRLDSSAGTRQADAVVKAQAAKGTLTFDLKVGQYVLYVAQRSKWRCVLTVTEKKN